jgi:hypothetical protein
MTVSLPAPAGSTMAIADPGTSVHRRHLLRRLSSLPGHPDPSIGGGGRVSATPTPDERTRYSSRRADQVEIQAWPEFDEEARGLLESVGEVIRPQPGELLWDAGDAYDLYVAWLRQSPS